jgi:hypothetical protein
MRFIADKGNITNKGDIEGNALIADKIGNSAAIERR